MTREERYRILSAYKSSDFYKFFQEDLEEQIKTKELETDAFASSGNTNMLFYHEGFKAGMKFAKDRPDKLFDDCERVFKRIINKVLG